MLKAKAFKHVHKNKEHPSSLNKNAHKKGVIMHIEMLVFFKKICLQRNYKSAC